MPSARQHLRPGEEVPHKVDRAGALAARQLAARVDDAWWDAARLAAPMPIPDLSIEGIAARLELTSVRWDDVAAAAGYFGNPAWSWER